jgi:uncharacterized protein (DUF952 family)
MIYHVTTEKEWSVYYNKDHYAPMAYEKEGFVHNCHLHQLNGVLDRYFAGRTDLLLLLIDDEKLVSPVRHETGTGNELFPHIYGTINKAAILKVISGRENFPESK